MTDSEQAGSSEAVAGLRAAGHEAAAEHETRMGVAMQQLKQQLFAGAEAPVVGERYELEERIGMGGLGVVYEAFDRALERRVAVKLLRRDRGAKANDRMVREAKLLARVRHDNVVRIYDSGVIAPDDATPGGIFIVMERLDGVPLDRWLAETARGWDAVLRHFIAAGKGLAAAHAAGLVHRDFKPENVIVDRDDVVRVLDFGLAVESGEQTSQPSVATLQDRSGRATTIDSDERLTADGTMVGTARYMAPEQRRDARAAGTRSDQYSFCVSLAEAFQFTDLLAPLDSVEAAANPKPRGWIPRGLRRVVARGLSVDPEARWPDMDRLLRALERTRRRRARGLVVVALTAGAAWGGVTIHEQRKVAACEAEGGAIETVWNDAAKAEVRAALTGTGIPYAARQADQVVEWLDRRAALWRATATEVCTNTRILERWDEATYAKAQWCLDEKRSEMEVLVGEIRASPGQQLMGALGAVAGLSAPEPCADAGALANRVEVPPEELRGSVVELRDDLWRASHRVDAFDHRESVEASRRILGRAETLGWTPLTALARMRHGALLEASGAHEAAAEALKAAYVEAGRSGNWAVAAQSATALGASLAQAHGDVNGGKTWLDLAGMAIGHANDPLRLLESARLNALGQVLATEGGMAEAKANYERSLELKAEALGDDHPLVADSLLSLGEAYMNTGWLDDGVASFQRAVSIREARFGAEHPQTGRALAHLAQALTTVERSEEGRAAADRALTILEASMGPEHRSVGELLQTLARLAGRTGDIELAKRHYQRSVRILEKALGPEHMYMGETYNNIGTFYRRRLRDRKTAIELYDKALVSLAASVEPDHWLIAATYYNRGETKLNDGRPAEGLADLRRAVGPLRAQLGAKHPLVGLAQAATGAALHQTGQHAAAIAFLDAAIKEQTTAGGRPPNTASMRFTLAKALWDAGEGDGRDRERSHTEATVALEFFRKAKIAPMVGRIEPWLAERE